MAYKVTGSFCLVFSDNEASCEDDALQMALEQLSDCDRYLALGEMLDAKVEQVD